jgi:hypothetical protein
LEVLVKLNDDRTTISVNENIEGKMIIKKFGVLTPGINLIPYFNMYKLDKHQMKDYVTTYLYVKNKRKYLIFFINFNL